MGYVWRLLFTKYKGTIELNIKTKSVRANIISESSAPYRIYMESANQLGLKLEEEG